MSRILNHRHNNNNNKPCIYYICRSLQLWALLALTTWCFFLFAHTFTISSRALLDVENDTHHRNILLQIGQRRNQEQHWARIHHQQQEEIDNLFGKQRGVVVHLETATRVSLAAAAVAAAVSTKEVHAMLKTTTMSQQEVDDEKDKTLHDASSSEHVVDTTHRVNHDDDDDDNDDDNFLEEEQADMKNENGEGVEVYHDEGGIRDENAKGIDEVDKASLDDSNENQQQSSSYAWVPTTTTKPAQQHERTDEIVHASYNCTNEKGQAVMLQQVPAFIIIGAQKAGTSAMYDLLNLHPDLQGSRHAEAHFFDRRLPIDLLKSTSAESKNQTWADEYRCKVREIYAKKFFPYEQLQHNPRTKFFDKTPAYITSTGAPFRVHAIAPWSKIVVSLRNPVHRAFSQHRMEWLPNQAHLTFEERLGVSLDMLRQMPQYQNKNSSNSHFIPSTDPFTRPSRELMSYNTTSDYAKIDGNHVWKQRNMIHRGFYLEQLQPWLEYYTLGKDLLVVRYEEFQRDPQKVLYQILDFVGVEHNNNTLSDSNIYNDTVLSQQYGPGRYRGSPGAIAECPPPTPEALDYLRKLYKPFNDELADVLGEEWRGVWD
jgi:Sulfotransferase domain